MVATSGTPISRLARFYDGLFQKRHSGEWRSPENIARYLMLFSFPSFT
jgi:hypothetical protein